MLLASRIREERGRVGLTLDDVAERARISKTYLWELEHDQEGREKPSADPLDTYLRLTGQKDESGNPLTSNPGTSGRYHSAWLSMMYPR
ncbi:MAG: helix-turn-helix transcriptional regulator, partial [Pirellulaceae bacterium]